MEHWTKIESYIHGELEGEDLDAFLKAMTKNPDLQKEVDRQGKLIASLEGMRLREQVKRHQVRDRQVHRPILAIWIGTAAAVAVLVVSAIWIYKVSQTDTAARQEQPGIENTHPSITPQQQTEDKGLARDGAAGDVLVESTEPRGIARSAKIREVYHDELKRFEIPDQDLMGNALAEKDLVEDLRRAYRNMQDDKPLEALRMLEGIGRVSTEWYHEDIEWMKALCFLLQDPDQGKKRLEVVANDPSHAYRIRALQVLGKLEK